MFIRSNMEIPVRYNKGEHSIELKPETITYVDDEIVSTDELVACYGDRITIISEEIVKEIMEGEKTTTGDEQVDSFINGEIDEVVDGTEVTIEEAPTEEVKVEEEVKETPTEEVKVEEEVKETPTEEVKVEEAKEAPTEETKESVKAKKASQTKSAKTGKGNK